MPLLTWRDNYRDSYLDATLLQEGRGRFSGRCSHCSSIDPKYRCRTCHGYRMLCHKCMLKKHEDEPLHIIEVISLCKIGMRYQLGHRRGGLSLAIPGHADFVVIASNGIHLIKINFSNQLLEIGWWPSTPIEPQTVATTDLLRITNPPTDFYLALEQMTDGYGLQKLPDRLSQWMLMLREWRHIKMVKRAGRGFDMAGIKATKQGELAIPCRACPQPGINLPTGWETSPGDIIWLYALILAEDANFKIKGRQRSNDEADPPLGPGWATFVNNEEYENHLARFVTQEEISHCVTFSALSKANSKGWKGLRATGIGSVSCARHEMFRPNGTGNLQKGERYVNMDFIFLSSIVATSLLMITISYDIACQWSKNFMTRMKDMPANLKMPSHVQIQYRVPKFHLPAHTEKCHAPYSFNFTRWVGRTDGEGVERNWSSLNGTARCVAVMRPGGRQDTLDDFCNFGNWRKTVGLGDALLRKLTWQSRKQLSIIGHSNIYREST
ncbi:hypothetical protein BD779DRAFT_1613679 [Infundibulicybe gibba]|nr:hypothetical protein BD779DRAFT_1613679 [Infundibulicybe gibba]